MSRYKLIVMCMLVVTGSALVACSESDVKRVAQEIDRISDEMIDSDGDFSNPDKLVDFLRGDEEDIVEEVPEEEEVISITYNVSLHGYDTDGRSYAVKKDEQSEEVQYSVVSCEEADEAGVSIITKSDLYGTIADGYVENVSEFAFDYELKDRLMQIADALFYLEYYPEGKREQEEKEFVINEVSGIGDIISDNTDDTVLLYNESAVLAKISYVIDDDEISEETGNRALDLWDLAESINNDDTESDANRAWAAAELFRITGSKTFRTVLEAVAEDTELNGFSYDDPGYYAMFAYLSAADNTDYEISSRFMDYFFTTVNGMIRTSQEDLLKDSILPEHMDDGSFTGEYIDSVIEECKLAVLADYISMSVEYTRYTEDRILFLCGANAIGKDYLDMNAMFSYEPVGFVLCGIDEQL